MATVLIQNGFLNHNGIGPLIVGVLLEGSVSEGDCIIVEEGCKVQILEVEFDSKTFPRITHIRMTVPPDSKVNWYTLYGKLVQTST